MLLVERARVQTGGPQSGQASLGRAAARGGAPERAAWLARGHRQLRTGSETEAWPRARTHKQEGGGTSRGQWINGNGREARRMAGT